MATGGNKYMRTHIKRAVFFAAATAAMAFFAARSARLDPQVESLVSATPQAVVIAEGTQGLSKTAKVVVTNVSKEHIHANVLWAEDWLTISPASFDLDPGKSTTLTITGNLVGLRQVITPVTRENQLVDLTQRPVIGVAPVTVSAGRTGTVFVVVGMRLGSK
jgi:hypothetical protein